MIQKQELGIRGEIIARRYLKGQNYIIHEQNWTFEKVEIDISAEKDQQIVFVEVKTRSTDIYGDPEEAVNTRKQQNILKAAEAYIEDNELDKEIRFDVISIVIQGSKERIYHIEDAISPYDE